MKKFILVTAVLLTTTLAQADIAAPPAPTGTTQATKPTKEERKARKAERKAMKEQHKAESAEMKEKINAACSADAATAGCTTGAGEGLMKCIHEYKASHPDFKVSESCMTAAHEGQHMRHERKEARKAMRGNKGAAAPAAPTTPETK